MRISAVFADGGVIRVNPSPHGGTWAFLLLDDASGIAAEKSGLITPAEIGFEAVSNNQSEVAAVLRALRVLPDGWSGPVHSDSRVALCTVLPASGRIGPRDWLPTGWLRFAQGQLRRLGTLTPVLLDGHPTKAHLAAGTGKRGHPVSAFNVRADLLCRQQAEQFFAGVSNR